MNFQRNSKKSLCKLSSAICLLFLLLQTHLVLGASTENQLLIMDSHLLLNPAHRKNALDTTGGASISVSTNTSNNYSRPQTFGMTANLPLIRDPQNVHSGWGVGLGAFFNQENDLAKLKSLKTSTFEISLGRSTIIKTLKESVGLHGFFEGGVYFANPKKLQNTMDSAYSISETKRRSYFIRLGAMSLGIGQGIVNFKPYDIDQSLMTSFVFPSEFSQRSISLDYSASIGCFFSVIYCGATVGFTNYSPNPNLDGFLTPTKWFAYGININTYFLERKMVLKTKVLWDSIKTTNKNWHKVESTPNLNLDLALIF